MALKTYLLVTNVTKGAAFAVREDNDEGAYVPASVNKEMQLEPLDRVQGVLIPNALRPDKTPWLMVRGIVVDETGEPLEFDEGV